MSGETVSPEFCAWTLRSVALGLVILSLGACGGDRVPGFLRSGGNGASDATGMDSSTQLAERDIEAPEVFQATESGLWDGRPSLGGIWVAHPDVEEPERVIMRNEKNGQSVIGALFRRERETPGPRLQVSSDAAAALGMLAGQPADLNVVALRREEGEDASGLPVTLPATGAAQLDAPSQISGGPLEPVRTNTPTAGTVPPPVAAIRPPSQTAAASGLAKPFIQIGIFGVEENADSIANAMRQAGMVPTVKQQSSSGDTFWRVLVGPAQNATERDLLLGKIKDRGFADAYAVSD